MPSTRYPQPGKGIQHICRRSASSQQSSTSLKSSSELMVVTVGIIPCSLLLVGLWPSVWPRCACETAGWPRRRSCSAIGRESPACYSSGTCQAAWPSVSVPQRGAAGTPCAPGSCSWPVRTPCAFPPRFLGPWPWWREVSSWRVWSAWFLRVACRVSRRCAGVKFF